MSNLKKKNFDIFDYIKKLRFFVHFSSEQNAKKKKS